MLLQYTLYLIHKKENLKNTNIRNVTYKLIFEIKSKFWKFIIEHKILSSCLSYLDWN